MDMEGAVKIQEKEYSKYCHRLKINANSAVCSGTSGNDGLKGNFFALSGARFGSMTYLKKYLDHGCYSF
jgi:hypothetical protein